jgi:hypothetical protein
VFSSARLFELFNLCVGGLALNVLLVAWLINVLWHTSGGNGPGKLLLLGLCAAGLLTATVKVIMFAWRRHSREARHDA